MSSKMKILLLSITLLAGLLISALGATASELTEEMIKNIKNDPALAEKLKNDPALKAAASAQADKTAPVSDKNKQLKQSAKDPKAAPAARKITETTPADNNTTLTKELTAEPEKIPADITIGDRFDLTIFNTSRQMLINETITASDPNRISIPLVGIFFYNDKRWSDFAAEIQNAATPKGLIVSITKLRPNTDEDRKKLKAEKKDPFADLEPYGHSLFDPSAAGSETGTADQNFNVPDNYIVGSGDTLNVYLWGRIVKTLTITVERDGSIYIPDFGKMTVAGRTIASVKKSLSALVSSVTGVQGDVVVSQSRSVRVMVLGEVKQPGYHTVSSVSSATAAIIAAGGVSDNAGIRAVTVKRGGKVLSSIDYYSFLLRGDTSSDVVLQAGDVIFVPKAGLRVAIAGAVKNPGIYEISSRDKLSHLIQMTGGFSASAYGKKIQVQRFVENRYSKVVDVESSSMDYISFKLADGDRILISEMETPNKNSVLLTGHVYFSGEYGLTKGMRIRDIVDADKLRPGTAMHYAYIKRYEGEGKNPSIISFDLKKALSSATSPDNLELKPLDEIHIIPVEEISPVQTVEVSGHVNRPGFVSIVNNSSVTDIINSAGGFATDADPDAVEVIRKEGNKLVTHFVEKARQGLFQLNSGDKVSVHSVWEKAPRQFIEIKGEVKFPGNYQLTERMTVNDLVRKAGGLTRDAYLKIAHLYRYDKNSFVPKMIQIDISSEHDSAGKMQLQDHDILVIHSHSNFKKNITVNAQGAVRKPGEYVYAEGMSISDLLTLAGGLDDNAFFGKGEITRTEITDGVVTRSIISFDVNKAVSGNRIPLAPYDIVTIKRFKEFGVSNSVTLEGEVTFPGAYAVTQGDKLSDVLKRAGGLTKRGFLRGMVFIRESTRQNEEKQIEQLRQRLEATLLSISTESAQTSLNADDAAKQTALLSNLQGMAKKLESIKALGRVVIQVNSISELESGGQDIIMEAGDKIIIPAAPTTVSVVGEVFNPSSFVAKGETGTVEDYIDKCGGLNELANDEMVYVIKADGTLISQNYISKNYWWKSIYDAELIAGDTVVVPRKIEFPSYMRDVKDITQIIFQIATTFAVTKAAF